MQVLNWGKAISASVLSCSLSISGVIYKNLRTQHRLSHKMSQSMSIRILLVTLLLGYVCVARQIDDCGDLNGYFQNEGNCEYSVIHCDGANSEYCRSQDDCSSTYDCPVTTTVAAGTTLSTLRPGTQTATTLETVATTTPSPINITTTFVPTDPTRSSTEVRQICQRGVTRKLEYPGNCNYYYHCLNGYLFVEQCPLGYAFNVESSSCKGRTIDVPNCIRR